MLFSRLDGDDSGFLEQGELKLTVFASNNNTLDELLDALKCMGSPNPEAQVWTFTWQRAITHDHSFPKSSRPWTQMAISVWDSMNFSMQQNVISSLHAACSNAVVAFGLQSPYSSTPMTADDSGLSGNSFTTNIES